VLTVCGRLSIDFWAAINSRGGFAGLRTGSRYHWTRPLIVETARRRLNFLTGMLLYCIQACIVLAQVPVELPHVVTDAINATV
jgi:hypothetical protein